MKRYAWLMIGTALVVTASGCQDRKQLAVALAEAEAASAQKDSLLNEILETTQFVSDVNAELAKVKGLTVAAEGFADRAYEADGSLTPRRIAGSMIHEVDAVVARAVRMVRESRVTARDGADLPLKVDTICVHGDTPGAAELAAAVRDGLERAGVELRAL